MLLQFTAIPPDGETKKLRRFACYIDHRNIIQWGLALNRELNLVRTALSTPIGAIIVEETPEEVAEMVLRAMPENEREIISAPPRERVNGEPASEAPQIHLA